jgi:hypothetical protein
MQRKTKWFLGAAVASSLLVGSVVATGVSAQTATSGSTGTGLCSGAGMMGSGSGPGPAMGAFRAAAQHDAIAAALGVTS